MPRIKSIAKRSLNIVVLLSAVLILNFFLLHLAPGDPAEVIAGDMGGATLELLAEIRTLYGLDLPLHEQLGNYLSRVIDRKSVV
jgi:peptide/nickel transport system permease protein